MRSTFSILYYINRNEGRIAYIQLGGKILYRESDIERMLADGYRTAYRLGATVT